MTWYCCHPNGVCINDGCVVCSQPLLTHYETPIKEWTVIDNMKWLKKRIQRWLEIDEIDNGFREMDEDLAGVLRERSELTDRLSKIEFMLHEIVDTIKMPVDWRLAQAKNSLNLLTSFINEIERDYDKNNQKTS
jgi:hypothetical protein